ncbi:MAG TPA: hypothetical protein VHP11_02650 [Tepidisphaeraceae bacterium]|nr:hypothetical protein [Tepidisphaeraceae bacterium]
MWQTYRQRFWWTQILILGVCAALKGYAGSPWTNVGVFFVVMQMSAVIGAWYGTRLARRIQEISERRPGDRP